MVSDDANEPHIALETNRGDILSGFHEVARDFCREMCLLFASDGVHLFGANNTNTVVVQYHVLKSLLAKGEQGTYQSSGTDVIAGINTKLVANCLSSVAFGDLVSFTVKNASVIDRFEIRCQNPLNGKCVFYSIVSPDIPINTEVRRDFSQMGYNSEIRMSSALFHDMLRDLSKSDAEIVRMCCDGTRLVLQARGVHINAAFDVVSGPSDSHFQISPHNTDRWPVCLCFSIDYLQRISKAKNVASHIYIYMKPDFPATFAYKTAIGELHFTVTFRDDPATLEMFDATHMPPPHNPILSVQPRERGTITKRNKDPDFAESSPSMTVFKKRRHK